MRYFLILVLVLINYVVILPQNQGQNTFENIISEYNFIKSCEKPKQSSQYVMPKKIKVLMYNNEIEISLSYDETGKVVSEEIIYYTGEKTRSDFFYLDNSLIRKETDSLIDGNYENYKITYFTEIEGKLSEVR